MKNLPFLDKIREVIHTSHFSVSTEKSYTDWIYRFIIFHNKRQPEELGGNEVAEFLTDLAVHRKSSASTQNQALNALTFLFKKVMKIEVPDFTFKVSNKEKRIPAILCRNEVRQLLDCLCGEFYLMAGLLYGCGLRLNECLGLRVNDIDFDQNQIIIRCDHGGADRRTVLPELLIPLLKIQIEKARLKFKENLHRPYFSGASMSEILDQKYPNASMESDWQFIFPSKNLTNDLQSGKLKQHHCHESILQKAVKKAIVKANINRNASCHSLRHSFALHLLEDGYDIRIIQDLLGHKAVRSTMVYKHMLHKNKSKVRSPLDV